MKGYKGGEGGGGGVSRRRSTVAPQPIAHIDLSPLRNRCGDQARLHPLPQHAHRLRKVVLLRNQVRAGPAGSAMPPSGPRHVAVLHQEHPRDGSLALRHRPLQQLCWRDANRQRLRLGLRVKHLHRLDIEFRELTAVDSVRLRRSSQTTLPCSQQPVDQIGRGPGGGRDTGHTRCDDACCRLTDRLPVALQSIVVVLFNSCVD
mmetsp:Transcript_18527/g.32998  ORF Transcript_18527/g.32998 Transcript_18527/m.32998 type:complete len:203 (-) Transcript_18527:2291-2899(-)